MTSPPPSDRINVRSIISLFENQTEKPKKTSAQLKRAKSTGHLFAKKIIPKSAPKQDGQLGSIESQIQELQAELKKYKKYSKDTHIYLQNLWFSLFSDVVNVEIKNNDNNIKQKKKELTELLKELNKTLNSVLPPGGESREKIVVKKREDISEVDSKEPPISEENIELDVSVKKLKFLFESKSKETVGLNEFAKTPLKRYSSFQHLRFDQKNKQNELPAKERIVHNASIKRNDQVENTGEEEIKKNEQEKENIAKEVKTEENEIKEIEALVSVGNLKALFENNRKGDIKPFEQRKVSIEPDLGEQTPIIIEEEEIQENGRESNPENDDSGFNFDKDSMSSMSLSDKDSLGSDNSQSGDEV